ncbi:DUF2304 domain-containing protein [Agromyces sp. G08B096]|uniref:DUF2304 domain-containing protein n=1 Tax=Agromyces sp. G08B096 TaxID=3156399 RepID=A0AAU7W3Q7_9MICO
MSVTTYVLGIAAAIATLVVVIELLRRRRLRERHAVWWLLAGFLALIIGIFPQVLVWAAGVVGIEIPTNLIFFVSLVLLFLVCIQHSSELTRLEDKVRILAEEQALARQRISDLEAAPSDDAH